MTMEDIRSRMNTSEHCPECGALLNGQSGCGNCGFEPEEEIRVASVIWLGVGADVLADEELRIA